MGEKKNKICGFSEMNDTKTLSLIVFSLIIGFVIGKLVEKVKTDDSDNEKEKLESTSGRTSMMKNDRRPSSQYHRNKRVSISYTSNDELENAPRRRLSAVYDKEQLNGLGETNEDDVEQ